MIIINVCCVILKYVRKELKSKNKIKEFTMHLLTASACVVFSELSIL